VLTHRFRSGTYVGAQTCRSRRKQSESSARDDDLVSSNGTPRYGFQRPTRNAGNAISRRPSLARTARPVVGMVAAFTNVLTRINGRDEYIVGTEADDCAANVAKSFEYSERCRRIGSLRPLAELWNKRRFVLKNATPSALRNGKDETSRNTYNRIAVNRQSAKTGSPVRSKTVSRLR